MEIEAEKQEQRKHLVKHIAEYFNSTELNRLYHSLLGERPTVTKDDAILDLVGYFERRNNFEELIVECEKERPYVEWRVGIYHKEAQQHSIGTEPAQTSSCSPKTPEQHPNINNKPQETQPNFTNEDNFNSESACGSCRHYESSSSNGGLPNEDTIKQETSQQSSDNHSQTSQAYESEEINNNLSAEKSHSQKYSTSNSPLSDKTNNTQWNESEANQESAPFQETQANTYNSPPQNDGVNNTQPKQDSSSKASSTTNNHTTTQGGMDSELSSEAEIKQFIQTNVCKIRCSDENGNFEYGTGFFIDEHLVLTCFHCIGDRETESFYNNIEVSDNNQKCFAHVVQSSPENDFAILYAEKSLCSSFEIPDKKTSLKYLIRNIDVYGYGFGLTVNEGDEDTIFQLMDNREIVAKYWGREGLQSLNHPDVLKLKSEKHIYPGQSGSPLGIIDDNGKFCLIGMLQGDHPVELSDSDDLRVEIYGLPIEKIRQKIPSVGLSGSSELKFEKVTKKTKRPFQITKMPITVNMSNVYIDQKLDGINYGDASSLARIFGGRLPTKKEWEIAQRQGKIITQAGIKEWIEPQEEDGERVYPLIECIECSGTKKVITMNHRPEAKRKTYGLRVVKDLD
ncbi:trypsin-like peptidase domain-containing protein [Candidatus Albibeggiatoa sp. nov. NOAA]|uniref:trypsin-like peptidase domain-containing protein n=1 Tax=Candidatus Albibeggiatoa sp. nov. NOAA TaxID=3162724 RepID=UPI0032FD3F1F|nr:trypsin-like peptidase domain-containing protein [Thiotrichaceae bacterium]